MTIVANNIVVEDIVPVGFVVDEELLKNNEIYRDIYELQKKGAEE